MATTPPPPSPSSLRVPGAPLHGAGYDTFEPYPTRYSARLANRRAMLQNDGPPPRYHDLRGQAHSSSSPKKQKKKAEPVLSLPGGNVTQTPTRGRHVNRIEGGHGSLMGSVNVEGSRYNGPGSSHFSSAPSTRRSETQSLPTPAKTPSKMKVTGDLSSTSRALFPPSKKPRRMDPPNAFRTPLDLNGEGESSSSACTSKGSISIFTDSRDRVPVAPSEDNPFSARRSKSVDPFKAESDSAGRVTPRRKVKVDSDEITYMFRGKRHTRRFMDDESEDDDPSDLGLFAGREHLLPDPSDPEAPTRRPRDFKPRMLWTPGGTRVTASPPTEDAPNVQSGVGPEPELPSKYDNEDEATDEEDATPATADLAPLASSVSLASSGSAAALASPAFMRKLRYSLREDGPYDTPTPDELGPTKKTRQTPFHAWLRKKKGPDDVSSAASSPKSSTTSAKREAEDESVGSRPKRTRANTTHANTV